MQNENVCCLRMVRLLTERQSCFTLLYILLIAYVHVGYPGCVVADNQPI